MKKKKKIILGLVGELGAGKTCASNHIIKKYKTGYHQYSNILRDTADLLYLEHSRKNLQKISSALRQTLGEDVLAKVITKSVVNDKRKIVIVDGIRRFPDIKYLRKLPNFYLIYVTADLDLRYQRTKKRKEKPEDDKISFNEFKKHQENEADNLIKIVAKKADFKIINNSNYNSYYNQLDKIITKLK